MFGTCIATLSMVISMLSGAALGVPISFMFSSWSAKKRNDSSRIPPEMTFRIVMSLVFTWPVVLVSTLVAMLIALFNHYTFEESVSKLLFSLIIGVPATAVAVDVAINRANKMRSLALSVQGS